jgi:hypothetical protein
MILLSLSIMRFEAVIAMKLSTLFSKEFLSGYDLLVGRVIFKNN